MVIQEEKLENTQVMIKEMPTVFTKKDKRICNSGLDNVGGQFSSSVATKLYFVYRYEQITASYYIIKLR